MKIIDTHAHIYCEEFDNDIEQVIVRAKEVGVSHILLPNVDISSIDRLHNIADTYPDYCMPMMGLHPTSVTENWADVLASIKQRFAERSYIAIGEIGMDLYWDKSLEKEQRAAFEEQLRWSIEYDLPVAIHSRDATMQCVECIKNVGANQLRGVFHSFGGNEDELDAIQSLKTFMIGVGGVVTFKNSNLSATLQKASLEQIIVETDAPYLTPVPYRGKRNEPAYTALIVEKLSDIYNIPAIDIAQITSENAKKLFHLSK